MWPPSRVWHLTGMRQNCSQQQIYLSSASGIRSPHCQLALLEEMMGGPHAKRQSSKSFCACASQTPNWLLSRLARSQLFQQCFQTQPIVKFDWTEQTRRQMLSIFLHTYEADSEQFVGLGPCLSFTLTAGPSLSPPPTLRMIQGCLCPSETKPLFWVDVPSQKAWLCLSQDTG